MRNMRLFILMLILSLAVIVCMPQMQTNAAGEARPDLLVDAEDLLDETEEEIVRELLNEVSDRHNMDVVIVTAADFGGRTSTQYADDFFDYQGYGRGSNYDGILLLVSEGMREWAISTCGYGIYAFTDAGQSYMTDSFVYYLSDGDYYLGFMEFGDLCDDFLEQAQTGEPYDVNNMPKEPFSIMWVLISLFIGLIVALIVTASMKSGMKTIRRQDVANDYMISGSLQLTDNREMYLYRQVSRTEKPKENRSSGGGGSSTHRSSSGRSHGGSSGRF